MDDFTPRLDVLPEAQRRLWLRLDALPPEFVLYGGTAVALHLGHRQSVDFDFFATTHLDQQRLFDALPWLAAAQVTQRAPDTLSVSVDCGEPVRLSFFGLPRLPRLALPHREPGHGVQVAALVDLAGTKAAVVQQRAEAKDYVDIDAILQDGRVGLPVALAAAAALYGGGFNPQITLKALSYFCDGNLAGLDPALRRRLADAARAVDLDRLPAIAGA